MATASLNKQQKKNKNPEVFDHACCTSNETLSCKLSWENQHHVFYDALVRTCLPLGGATGVGPSCHLNYQPCSIFKLVDRIETCLCIMDAVLMTACQQCDTKIKSTTGFQPV